MNKDLIDTAKKH